MKNRNTKNKRKILGLILIAAGLCIFLIPIIWQSYVNREQEKMQAQLKQQIEIALAAAKTSEPPETVAQPESADPDENAFLALDFEDDTTEATTEAVTEETTEEEKKEEKKEDTSLDYLKGQKLLALIEIPAIDITYAVVEGTERWNIRLTIGHFKDSAAIGQEGNCAVAGHRGGINGIFFKYLYKLKDGDEVIFTTVDGKVYTYEVYEQFIVEPTEMWVVADMEEEGAFLTMVTCTDDGTQRRIVRAKLTGTQE